MAEGVIDGVTIQGEGDGKGVENEGKVKRQRVTKMMEAVDRTDVSIIDFGVNENQKNDGKKDEKQGESTLSDAKKVDHQETKKAVSRSVLSMCCGAQGPVVAKAGAAPKAKIAAKSKAAPVMEGIHASGDILARMFSHESSVSSMYAGGSDTASSVSSNRAAENRSQRVRGLLSPLKTSSKSPLDIEATVSKRVEGLISPMRMDCCPGTISAGMELDIDGSMNVTCASLGIRWDHPIDHNSADAVPLADSLQVADEFSSADVLPSAFDDVEDVMNNTVSEGVIDNIVSEDMIGNTAGEDVIDSTIPQSGIPDKGDLSQFEF